MTISGWKNIQIENLLLIIIILFQYNEINKVVDIITERCYQQLKKWDECFNMKKPRQFY